MFEWLPNVERAVTVGEGVAETVKGLLADVDAVRGNPVEIVKLVEDAQAAIPAIVAAVHANVPAPAAAAAAEPVAKAAAEPEAEAAQE